MPNTEIAQTGRAARALVEHRYNRERYVNAMLSLYSSLGAKV
jgi:hypothetical protein